MSKLIKVPHSLLVLLVMVTLLGSLNLFAVHGHKTKSQSSRRGQQWISLDLSGRYEGEVYFAGQTPGKILMQGPAKLKIDKERFTFTAGRDKQLTGTIETRLKSDQYLSVGRIQLDTEPSPIEIRWYRDKKRHDKLWLMRAKGANRLFSFCSKTLSKGECEGRFR